MKILIIGAGSLGSLFGAKLALAGNEVFSFVSKRYLDYYIKGNPLFLENTEGKTKKINNFNVFSLKQKAKKFDFKIIIIATKAYSLKEVCKQYKELIQNTPVFLLQNGIGNEETIKEMIPKNKILYRIITSNGAYMKKAGLVQHTGYGETNICPMFKQKLKNSKIKMIEEKTIKTLKKAKLNPVLSDTPKKNVWEKALINIGINVFGALTHLKNGQLTEIKGISNVIGKTLQEAINIAKKKLNLEFERKNMLNRIYEILKATSKNKNSMLQDVMKQKRTEISYLNGKIISYGEELGIKTPYNELLTVLIRGLEKSYN